jgi:isopentenyl-diphosphate delta-isomerase
LADKVAKICSRLPVPVIAKEVGWGFSEADVRLLMEAGVSAIDVAGAGGTSWSQVEMHRAKNDSQRRLAAAFLNWGIPTSQAIQNVRRAAPDLLIFASGGLRSGIDIAKCLALGAALGGMAGPFLKAASQSAQAVFTTLEEVTRELQICMFAAGAGDLAALQQTQLVQRQKD